MAENSPMFFMLGINDAISQSEQMEGAESAVLRQLATVRMMRMRMASSAWNGASDIERIEIIAGIAERSGVDFDSSLKLVIPFSETGNMRS